jgi:alpha-D-ribose 1-methylphosphonate 5-phosphate C-P lyase
VKSLDFDDHPFEIERWTECCALCGARESFLDEMIVDDAGKRLFVCSDTDYCRERQGEHHT